MHREQGLILLDDSGKFVWASPAASKLLGYPDGAAFLGRLGNEGPIAQALEKLNTDVQSSASGNTWLPGHGEVRVCVNWTLWRLPRPAANRRQYLLQVSGLADEASATPPPSSYRHIFGNAVEGTFRALADGRFLEVNPSLAAIFGHSGAADFMESVENFQHLCADSSKAAEFVDTMLQRGLVSGLEAQMHRGERRIWVAIFARTVTNEAGEPMYFEGSIIDISELKRREEALRTSEEKFRLLAESTRAVPFEFDPRLQRFTYIGPQAETLFGQEFRTGLTLDRWASLINPSDADAATRFVLEPVPAEGRDFQVEFRVATPGTGALWVRQIVHRASLAERSDLIRGFLFDITEAKRLEEERERSRIQLRELAAQTQMVREEERMVVAREIHDELGQALTMLKIELSWINGRLTGLRQEEITKPLLEKIGSMEQRIHWTLQSMRRILSSLRPPLLDESGLKDAIEFHLQDFSRRLPIRYDWEASPAISLPANAETAVFRIFQEILTNVAKHASASRLKVTLHQDDRDFRLTVQDNGCGITQEKLSGANSFGLLGMQERAWAIGGELEVLGSPRSGTRVLLKVPLGKDSLERDAG